MPEELIKPVVSYVEIHRCSREIVCQWNKRLHCFIMLNFIQIPHTYINSRAASAKYTYIRAVRCVGESRETQPHIYTDVQGSITRESSLLLTLSRLPSSS